MVTIDYAAGNASSIRMPSPYQKNLHQVKKYLYEMHCDSLRYDLAYDFMANNQPEMSPGGCSAVRNGNWYGRNLDWTYDESAEFIVQTPRTDLYFATIGVAGCLKQLSNSFVLSGEESELYDILPFYLLDGINEFGVVANTNVVPTDYGITTGTTPTGTKEIDISSAMLVRYILDHFRTADEAVTYMSEHMSIYVPATLSEMGYESHIMIADPDKTYVVEFIENELRVINVTDKPYMTNFHLTDVEFDSNGKVIINRDGSDHNLSNVTPYGSGLERYNLIVDNYESACTKFSMRILMNELKYTKSYILQPNLWYTEFVGGDITVTSERSEYSEVIAEAMDRYEHRSRNEESEYFGTWQTTHSVVYDIYAKKMYLICQEDGKEMEYSLRNQIGGSATVGVRENWPILFRGLAAERETMRKDGIPNGSMYIEIDGNDIWYYSAGNQTWYNASSEEEDMFFIIHGTASGSSVQLDKTYAQITNAIGEDKVPVIFANESVFSYVGHSAEGTDDLKFAIKTYGDNGAVSETVITLNSSDICTIESYDLEFATEEYVSDAIEEALNEFVVTFTMDMQTMELISDKTFSEINTALVESKNVKGELEVPGMSAPLAFDGMMRDSEVTYLGFIFSSKDTPITVISNDGINGDEVVHGLSVMIKDDNTITAFGMMGAEPLRLPTTSTVQSMIDTAIGTPTNTLDGINDGLEGLV